MAERLPDRWLVYRSVADWRDGRAFAICGPDWTLEEVEAVVSARHLHRGESVEVGTPASVWSLTDRQIADLSHLAHQSAGDDNRLARALRLDRDWVVFLREVRLRRRHDEVKRHLLAPALLQHVRPRLARLVGELGAEASNERVASRIATLWPAYIRLMREIECASERVVGFPEARPVVIAATTQGMSDGSLSRRFEDQWRDGGLASGADSDGLRGPEGRVAIPALAALADARWLVPGAYHRDADAVAEWRRAIERDQAAADALLEIAGDGVREAASDVSVVGERLAAALRRAIS
jgi:hypothetical protein